MKKIIESRKLLGVDKTAELKELKGIYRNFMKDWHPDKFHNNQEAKEEAEARSKAGAEEVGIGFLAVVGVEPSKV